MEKQARLLNNVTETQAIEALQKALMLIRQNTPKQEFNKKLAASSDVRIGFLKGKPVKRLVITLRSTGCGWVEKSHGCTMCGHYAGSTKGEKLSEIHYLEQFNSEIKKYDLTDIPILCLYNGGSVLNNEEVPAKALTSIYKEVSKIKEIKKVVVEARSEYINEESIENIRKNLKKEEIEIALGLESTNSKIRKLCLNKGLDITDFERAVKMIKKDFGLRLYLMLKPIFLTESEGIEDAVKSYRESLCYAADEVHFEPATVQKHTLSYFLYERGEYRVPWLWSIIEVLRQLGAGKNIYISPFTHTPSPLIVPHNCDKCTKRITKTMLEEYNRTFDISVFDGLSCGCQGSYEEELKSVDTRPLEDRVYTTSTCNIKSF